MTKHSKTSKGIRHSKTSKGISRRVRDAIDVAVFLEPDEELRHRWKLERDVFERGYSPKEVVAELKRRAPDAAEHIQPSATTPT